MKKSRRVKFQFKPFSKKQRQVLNWWTPDSPVKTKNGLIADGAIRSGKTVCMSLSFVLWAMDTFNGYNFGMCGKTIASFGRNVLGPLMQMLASRHIAYVYHRGDNLLTVSFRGRTNDFFIFGGKDESSQALVQGVTLAGVFFDEVALMPQSFVNQATARCSVDGSKWWFNCNPEGSSHWFKTEWIDKAKDKGIVYRHFTMDDNLSLSEKIKERYRAQYSGVFYERFILGHWVIAEGIIYDNFDKKRHAVRYEDIEDRLTQARYVSCDYGTQNATVFLLWNKGTDGVWYCVKEYYYSGRDQKKQKTDNEYVEDLVDFIGDLSVRAIVIDPSAASFIEAVRRADLPVVKANNDVLDGIREVGVALNKETIKYVDTCKNTFDEYGAYCWDEKAAERGEDAPIKQNDHAMDATRYFVHTIMNKNKAIVRSKTGRGFN